MLFSIYLSISNVYFKRTLFEQRFIRYQSVIFKCCNKSVMLRSSFSYFRRCFSCITVIFTHLMSHSSTSWEIYITICPLVNTELDYSPLSSLFSLSSVLNKCRALIVSVFSVTFSYFSKNRSKKHVTRYALFTKMQAKWYQKKIRCNEILSFFYLWFLVYTHEMVKVAGNR